MQIPYKTESTGCGSNILTLLLVIGLAFFFSWIGWLLWAQ